MLQKSVEDFAENDIKFKELVKIAQYLRDLRKMEDKFQNQRNKVEILDIEGSSDGK